MTHKTERLRAFYVITGLGDGDSTIASGEFLKTCADLSGLGPNQSKLHKVSKNLGHKSILSEIRSLLG